VKAPSSDNVKVFLEGRFFGTAPLTIYSVPKGDYIVEGTYPDGKTVSKAVSVLENDEAVADLTGAHAAVEANKKGSSMFSNKDISENRLFAMKAFAIGGGIALVAGITFGVLEMMKESDYKNSTGTQTQLDSLTSTGKNYALLANVGYALAFVGAVGAAVCAYPIFVKPSAEKKTVAMASSHPVFVVVPTSGGASGSMALRF
jgi:quinol-cytochrome oxidoreductase complex cytochrome b subunit